MMNKLPETVSFMGISLALLAVLSVVDSMLSAVFPIPGVRLGLSNVVIILILLKMGLPYGITASLLRSGFVFLTRGATAGIMSLSGGILSFSAVFFLLCVMKRSYNFSSLISSVFHVVGQIIAACLLTNSFFTVYYLPVLIPAAVATGILTGNTVKNIIMKLSIRTLYRKD